MVVSASFSGLEERGEMLEYSYKAQTRAAAEGFVSQVLLRLSANPNYQGEEIFAGQLPCDVALATGDSPRTFLLRTSFRDVHTVLGVVCDPSTATIISVREIP